MESKVTLVGAGPGDPELISFKAIKAIQQADAILYDALVDISLLEYAKPNASILYVGKRRGCKTNKQEAINDLLVHYAQKYGNVVRLKGGDPFVFGRGFEEMRFVESFGIPVTYIPGISSCISVPGLENIPVTLRGVNESFWVTTATLSTGELSHDIHFAAQSSATIVILMGLSKLEEIAKIFNSIGKENLPVVVIESGSNQNKQSVFGYMEDIFEKVKAGHLKSPAIIVAGEVVRSGNFKVYEKLEQTKLHGYAFCS
jgi:uroporphyrin-III C-methyltransferase